MDVRFHPLATWPAKPTPANKRKSRWSFRSSLTDTLGKLKDEIRHLSGRDVVIEVALDPADIRIDGWPRSNAKVPRHPGVILSFESKHGPLRYLTDRYEIYEHNLRAIALGLEALRAVDRYGITERGEQYVGWKALPTSTNDTPISVLLSVTGRTLGMGGEPDGKSLYREALKVAHPDQGGDPETFARVQEAGRRLGVA